MHYRNQVQQFGIFFFKNSKYIHMKQIFIAGFVFASFQLKAQLVITPGAELYMTEIGRAHV